MATIYVTTGGNDSTGNGTSGNPYLTIGKALTVAASGDTINIGAGTFAIGNTTLDLSNGGAFATGVSLVGASSATTIITGTNTGAASHEYIPIVWPGVSSTVSNLTIKTAGSGVSSQACIGCYYASLSSGHGNSGLVAFPVSWSVSNCILDASAQTTNIKACSIIMAWHGDESSDGISISQIPHCAASFSNCTINSPTSSVRLEGTYADTLGGGEYTIPLNGMVVNLTDCTLTAINTVGTSNITQSTLNNRCTQVACGIVNLYRCTVTATDTINGASDGSQSGNTMGLSSESWGVVNAWACTVTTSRPLGTTVYDIQTKASATAIPLLIVTGCTYNHAKTSGTNIIDVSVFPTAAQVKSTISFGPTGADLTGTLAGGGGGGTHGGSANCPFFG